MKYLLVLLLLTISASGFAQSNDAPVQMAGGAMFTDGGTTEFVMVGGGSQSILTTYWDRTEQNPNEPKARLSIKEYIYSTPGKGAEFEGGASFAMLQVYPGNFYLGVGPGTVLDIKTGANDVYAAYAIEAAYRWSIVSFTVGGQYLFGDADRQIVFAGVGVRP